MVSTDVGYLRYFNDSLTGSLPPNLQWFPLAILATFIVILIHGLLFGIGRAFSSQELERYAKSEILNAFATVLLVVFLIPMIIWVDDFAKNYFFGTTTAFDCGGETMRITELGNSIDLLKCRLGEKAQDFARIQEQVTAAATGSGNPFNKLSINFSLIGIPVFSGSYISSWFTEAENYRIINHLLTVMLIGINSILVLADYAKNNMLSVFLPLGMILRAFHFTRGIGAFFMSLGIGFYFIFPVLYIITDPAYARPAYVSPYVDTAPPLCVQTFSGIIHSIYGAQGAASSGGIGLSLDQLKNDLASIYTSVLIQPFVAFALTLVFVRYIMYVLGGEPQDLMRGVMKLV